MLDKRARYDLTGTAPAWLRRAGGVGWLFLGVALATTVALSALATLSTIIDALLLAIVIGSIFRPVVDMLARRRLNRNLGTVLTLILILLGAGVLITILVQGLLEQGPQIGSQLEAGWISLRAWLLQLPIDPAVIEAIRIAATDYSLAVMSQGVVGLVASTFSGVAGFLVGLYFGGFILFFILRDGPDLEAWLARQFGFNPAISAPIMTDVSRSLRLYFKGTALTAAITSLVVAIPLIILDVPLVASILIVYFFTSFVPYLGAWIGGAFAVLIAFGSGGVQTGLIILAAVIISNGALQSAVNSSLVGSSLRLHPLVVFLVTIAAGVLGGLLAMVLAVPLTAVVVQTMARLREEGVLGARELPFPNERPPSDQRKPIY
jgi:predicted PurR-regulated permease PerM